MNKDSPNQKCVRLRDRFREETSEAILSAAEEVFANEGLHGARMESIAAGAGVAVGTVYNHFEDREALLRELIESRRAALVGKLDAALAEGKELPFIEALRLFIRALYSHWVAHHRFLTVLLQAEMLKPLPPRNSKGCSTRQEIRARAEELVRRGQAAGALRPETGELQAGMLVGLTWGLLTAAVDQGRIDRVQDQLDPTVDLFLHGAGR